MKNIEEMKPLSLEEMESIVGGGANKFEKDDLSNEPILIRGCCNQGCCDEPPQIF
ncbi:hypothetical protein [Pseudoalteromonas luteoviolacea]|uniref:Bacteriocin n=1 Tax=Pseudoalteromonas luteoviolacea DSM 6061 TaxID=1365250 RepID=A0A166WLY2_9GAMM|nr:hypothetical protein [Pseudoalteromonas luteoviolacea]KZN37636.1 hypothetical protein N475_02170 [Pseudoalteromonas luteoviolacea DSM 6061]KZN49662.1 hypothetical protein N474_05260 [Pseudoalteromonas luteoviolacea CPMOR-2]MBE0386940.1 hypothetical protein [Pseudoalteromonas luteoviolacea DSM 6061]